MGTQNTFFHASDRHECHYLYHTLMPTHTIYVTTNTTNKKTSQPTFKIRQSNGLKFFKLSCDLENGSQLPRSVRTCEAQQSIMHGFKTHLHSIWWMLTRFSLRHETHHYQWSFPEYVTKLHEVLRSMSYLHICISNNHTMFQSNKAKTHQGNTSFTGILLTLLWPWNLTETFTQKLVRYCYTEWRLSPCEVSMTSFKKSEICGVGGGMGSLKMH